MAFFPLTMSNDERKASILEGMLIKASKNYVCPACFKSNSQASGLRNHLKQMKEAEDHKGLSEREEAKFRYSYETIMGWKPTDKEHELDLPRERIVAFTRDVVVTKMASRAEDFVQSKIQIYLQIAVSSGMTHVCPECVDEDGQYFNKMVDFDRHCWEKSDQTHMSLLSKVPATFLPTYLIAMGLSEIEELPPGHDKPGRWTNERYLRTAYVFKAKKRYSRTMEKGYNFNANTGNKVHRAGKFTWPGTA
jgi:hypothetical protein